MEKKVVISLSKEEQRKMTVTHTRGNCLICGKEAAVYANFGSWVRVTCGNPDCKI